MCHMCSQECRRECEESARQNAGQSADEGASTEIKQEGGSPVESPGGEDSSSNIADSPALDTDAEVDGTAQDIKMEESDNKQNNSPSEKSHDEMEEDEAEEEEDKQEQADVLENSQLADMSGEQLNGEVDPHVVKFPGASDAEKESVAVQHEGSMAVKQKTHKLQELVETQEKAIMFDKFRNEDPTVMSLCTKLFPDNNKSIWNGPHSLFGCHNPTPVRSSIHSAIEMLMK